MATLLMLVIFSGFIGLGIPDSMFGASWPAIYSDLNLPISYANYITVLISVCCVISSMMSGRVNAKYSAAHVSIVSTLLTAIGLLGFSFSGNLLFFCLFAIPLGFGAGTIDSALNHYTALHYSARAMNFLHCSYGIGVTVSPFLLSLALSGDLGWRGGYRIAFCVQLLIAFLFVLSLPLWKRVETEPAIEAPISETRIKFSSAMKLPGFWTSLCLIFASCAIEFTCGTWGSTFLVETKHLPAHLAARTVMFYYLGMALGRILSGIFAPHLSSKKIIRMGVFCMTLAISLLFFVSSPYLAGFALFFVGLGNGPVFPNMMHLTPKQFECASASVMGFQIASGNIGILLAPPIFGLIGERFGVSLMPWYLLIFLIPLLITCTAMYRTYKRV
ncbi:MAG: MFS transporter [Ruminococcaceae bacterium]|nr:MFS transporter [Oscillospiraceae bacterium]